MTNPPCSGQTAVFFPDDIVGRRAHDAYDEAKAICAECPYIDPCGSGAIARREPRGVWGGLSPTDRQVILGQHVRAGMTKVSGRRAIEFLAEVA